MTNVAFLLLALGPGRFGLTAGASTMLFENLYWIGPCAEVLDNVGTTGTSLLLKVNYVYNYAVSGFIPGFGGSPKLTGWGHGLGLGFELIPHVITTAAGGCCIRGCLGVDPYIGLSGNLIRRAVTDTSKRWDLWLLGYAGANVPIGYRDTLTGEPKLMPFEINLFLSAGFTRSFSEVPETHPVVMIGLGLNIWLFRIENKAPYREVKP